MSSTESNSNSPPPSPPPEAQPHSSVAVVALTLVLLAVLVWAMAPPQSRLKPAPLRPVPSGCPITLPAFVPSDATEVPGADLTGFTKAHRNHVLFRLNMEPCACGCNASVAVCRVGHPACPLAKGLVDSILAEERQDSNRASGK